MSQDFTGGTSIVSVFSNVRPGNAPGRVNDKHRWRSDAITKQIEHAIRIGYGVTGIRQDGIFGTNALCHLLRARYVLIGQRQNLGIPRAELTVRCLQLTELRPAGASGLPTIENERHARPVTIVAETNGLAVLP